MYSYSYLIFVIRHNVLQKINTITEQKYTTMLDVLFYKTNLFECNPITHTLESEKTPLYEKVNNLFHVTGYI